MPDSFVSTDKTVTVAAPTGWLLREVTSGAGSASRPGSNAGHFVPAMPETLEETGVPEARIEQLTLKFLLNRSVATGREIAAQLKLPFALLERLIRRLRDEQVVVYKRGSGVGDFDYQLTELGAERARGFAQQSRYYGAVPVAFADYVRAVDAQSARRLKVTPEKLRRALSDLSLDASLENRLGQAITAGQALFLFGAPGNGKTSIAERLTEAWGDAIWIPRALEVDGELIRLFDPTVHHELPLERDGGSPKVDERWIRIRRPTIVVGGELTLSSLEISSNPVIGILEAAVQLKSNCGTLVIDDFGRQRVTPDELLNRWIVPLEKQYDYLNLPNGKKLQVPFDQLTVFSTNLDPRKLVDEAFLRRIPYKIEVRDPSEAEFRQIFRQTAGQMGLPFGEEVIDHLLETQYHPKGRALRFCHPRDLLRQVQHFCRYNDIPPCVTAASLDQAAENYFAAS